MAKRCVVCGDQATFKIKDSSEFYCEECAEMQFGDTKMLQKLEKEAQMLKRYIEERDKEEEIE